MARVIHTFLLTTAKYAYQGQVNVLLYIKNRCYYPLEVKMVKGVNLPVGGGPKIGCHNSYKPEGHKANRIDEQDFEDHQIQLQRMHNFHDL
jgi:hypothetical protein